MIELLLFPPLSFSLLMLMLWLAVYCIMEFSMTWSLRVAVLISTEPCTLSEQRHRKIIKDYFRFKKREWHWTIFQAGIAADRIEAVSGLVSSCAILSLLLERWGGTFAQHLPYNRVKCNTSYIEAVDTWHPVKLLLEQSIRRFSIRRWVENAQRCQGKRELWLRWSHHSNN